MTPEDIIADLKSFGWHVNVSTLVALAEVVAQLHAQMPRKSATALADKRSRAKELRLMADKAWTEGDKDTSARLHDQARRFELHAELLEDHLQYECPVCGHDLTLSETA